MGAQDSPPLARSIDVGFEIWGLKSRGRKNPVSEGNCVILAGESIDLGCEIWDLGFKKKFKSALEQL
ncbi:hypothetical protein C7B69_05585 [filamentous cyanobacterium Phorm 46]|nr:hypothetical protein C7B69_05585 [filamentous cyanobacterium Phorm 46]